MRKRAASGKSTSCWRLSFWLFSIGFRIITALFHKKKARKALILQGFLCLFVLPEADFRRVRFSFFILHYTRFIP